ncbi:MAG: hypothetical protein IIZ62_05735 [Ruminococcus sp.]|nr:hypothetical protein [Ruminococcus sp.]
MAYCHVCGEHVADNAPNCPKCGAPLNQGSSANGSSAQQNVNDFVNKLNNTADYSNQMDPSDVNDNKAMAVLAYLGLLVFIPIFAAPQSKFARYHSSQGLTLFIFEAVYWVLMTILSKTIGLIPVFGTIIVSPCGLIGIVWLVLMICGIVNAVNGKAKDLPVIGGIRFLK